MDPNYLTKTLLTLQWPWVLAVVVLWHLLGANIAAEELKVDKPSAEKIALISNYSALLVCMPVALFVPPLLCVNLLVYYVGAVGLQTTLVRLFFPDLDGRTVSRWAYSANNQIVGLTLVGWIGYIWFCSQQNQHH
jgi:hypothetical protein